MNTRAGRLAEAARQTADLADTLAAGADLWRRLAENPVRAIWMHDEVAVFCARAAAVVAWREDGGAAPHTKSAGSRR